MLTIVLHPRLIPQKKKSLNLLPISCFRFDYLFFGSKERSKRINISNYTKGFFLGTTIICFKKALSSFLQKRNWLTLVNVFQILLWLTRNVSIIVFAIVPGILVNCGWRQYFVGLISSSVIVAVWWLQFIKFQSMYTEAVWFVRIIGLFCFTATAATFPYIATKVTLDSLNHCAVKFDETFQAWYIAADVSLEFSFKISRLLKRKN